MKDQLELLKPRIMEIFHHLHDYPEISWEEHHTTKYIHSILKEANCKITTFQDCTGVVGEVGSGDITVGLRADMDALWQEVDGEFRANHSCGHDAHMAILLGTILLLREIMPEPKGKLKYIFQPAEEKGTGAKKMIEKGVVDDVDFLFGVHLRPIQELPHGKAAPAIMHGAAQFLKGRISGDDTHGARPHLGTNAIEIGASFVHLINQIHIDPMIPYSAKMTQFNAGGQNANIIPGSATFSLDLRAQTNEKIRLLESKISRVAETLSKIYDVKVTLEKMAFVAAAEVSEEAATLLREAITQTLGKENLSPALVTTGGEDFHFYTLERPHLKATILGLGCDLQPGLHHPKMSFNHEAIFHGIEVMVRTVLLKLDQAKGGN